MSKYEQVETGIYKYIDSDDNVTYHERSFINGKRTYRSLGFGFTKQTSLKHSREEYHRRRTEIAAGRNPYEEKNPPRFCSSVHKCTVPCNLQKHDFSPNCTELHRTIEILSLIVTKLLELSLRSARPTTFFRGAQGVASADQHGLTGSVPDIRVIQFDIAKVVSPW